MTKYILLLCVFVVPFMSAAQTNVTEGARLLFGNEGGKLTAAQKNEIYRLTGFQVSRDKKQFIMDKESLDFPFEAFVLITDLNKDGKEEVFVQYGNSFTSGHTGSSILLFIPNASGIYQRNLGFPGVEPEALVSGSQGYPDLLIGGPGFEFPVWRWNGKEYVFFRKIKDAELSKTKRTPVYELSQVHKRSNQ